MKAVQSGVLQLFSQYWLLLLLFSFSAFLVKNYFKRGLNRYPGPFLANFTDGWRAWDVWRKSHHETIMALHERYGPVVRTGPNTLDIADVEYIPKVFGINKGFEKTDFYRASDMPQQGRIVPSLFSMKDEKHHTARKRPIAGMYALSAMRGYEPLVDDMIVLFMDRLQQEFSDTSRACDMAQWLQYFAFDVVLNISFGSTLGFLSQGSDAGGFIETLEVSAGESAVMTQMPWLRYIRRHNPVLRRWLRRDDDEFPQWIRQQMHEHAAKIEGDSDKSEERLADLLTRFMRIPGLERDEIISHSLNNIFAGSDTTTIAMRTILYFLHKQPHALQTLQQELRAANLSYPVTWAESQQLPYLHAVIEESLRLFPPFGLSLERQVPTAGLEMSDGYILPPGTAVGMTAWTVNRDYSVFGPLPTEQFLPERWLKGEDELEAVFERRLAAMRRSNLTFGWGKRVCIGRNISTLEIYKMIPTLLLEFEMGLVDPQADWKIKNAIHVKQSNMDFWLRRRTNRPQA